MEDDAPSPPSHFFTLRLWPEAGEDDEPVWRGRVQHTASREVGYFQSWAALREILLQLMDTEASLPTSPPERSANERKRL